MAISPTSFGIVPRKELCHFIKKKKKKQQSEKMRDKEMMISCETLDPAIFEELDSKIF